MFFRITLTPTFGLAACASFFVGIAGVLAGVPDEDPLNSTLSLPPKGAKLSLLSGAKSTRKEPGTASRGQIQLAKPGPWGELEFFTTYLEVPLDLLKANLTSSLALDWNFVGVPEADVEKLFRSLELPEPIRVELLDTGKWRGDGSIVTVTPSPKTLETLPPAARAAIYTVLGRFSENRFHAEPTLVPGGDVDTWLRNATLRPEIVETIKKTLFRRGQSTLFADRALVLRMAESDAERLAIRKALSRTATLVGKVRLGPETNAAKLAEYWSAGQRSKDAEPFLESMLTTDGVDQIDLVHLLPANVRRLLYTFPNESHGRSGYYPDCHWTSLNFFNYEPLERLAEPPLATAYTLENYVEVPKADQLGDILFFMDRKTGNTFHSCVFIADDIVFTKNGRSRYSPWLLMRLGELRELYGIYQQTDVVAYRRKAVK